MLHETPEHDARSAVADRDGPTIWLACGLTALLAAMAGAAPPEPVDFAHDIVPILKSHCVKCHTSGTYKGGFSLDTRAAMIKSESVVAGKSDESELVERLVSDELARLREAFEAERPR